MILAAYYLIAMLHSHVRPGISTIHPEGWWGWSDQRLYLRSVLGLARLDFTASQHWYPLGYALLGAPFAILWPRDPFLLIDLACLLTSFLGFLGFARHCGFRVPVAVAAFLLGSVGSAAVASDWIIPWTTTPACAAIWLFLAACARQLDAAADEARAVRSRRIVLIGCLAVAIPLFRPTDAVVPVAGLSLMLWWSLRDRMLRLADVIALLFGSAMLLLPYGLLYLRIYGPHPTRYMLNSRGVGFQLQSLPAKTVLLLISPRPWFPFGSGLLARLPWIALALAGILLLPTLQPRPARRGMTMLAAMMLTYMALMFSYVDLLPSGLWLYHNVHYFKWLFPGMALFGIVFLRGLLFERRALALLAAGAVLLLTGIRLEPVRVAAGSPARMLQYPSDRVSWQASYFGHERLTDRQGSFENVINMRVLPDSQGVRVISLSRPLVGTMTWQNTAGLGTATMTKPTAWGLRIGFGWPCWLPRYSCDRMQPHG